MINRGFPVFEYAKKEGKDLRQRIRERTETARLNGKQIGSCPDEKHITKKTIKVNAIIEKHSSDFNGNLSDVEIMQMAGVSRNHDYRCKKELRGRKDNIRRT